ncbi:MAG TPA: hypothetical protein VGR78_02760, partial [Verrucomicrobiae bacterium]|nr:hypothetical protein [Verrucomicrobiae bacterium]
MSNISTEALKALNPETAKCPLEVYFDPDGKYWALNAYKEWHKIDREILRLKLKQAGRRSFLLKA